MKLHVFILPLLLLKVSFSNAQTCHCTELEADKEISIATLLSSKTDFCTAKGFEKLASQFLDEKKLDSAAHYLGLAETLFQKEACKTAQWITIYKLRSALHFSLAEYEKALDYSLKMLALSQEKGNKEEEAELLLGISQIFARLKQLEKGLTYVRQSLPLIETLQPGPSKVDLLNKAGSRFYFFFQDTKSVPLYDSAKLYFTLALQIAKTINYKKGMQVSYNKMNSLAYQQKNFELSLRYIDSSIALSEPGKINNTIATSFGDKGNILLKLGRFREAKKWADSCLYYNQELKFPPLIANAYSLVAEIADSLGDFASAYHALYLEKKITDSLNTAENAKAVTEVEKKYIQAKNEKTIRELNQQKQIYALLAIAGLLAAGIIAFYLRQQSLKNRQKILETEQRLNRARMNPHFFFNALTALQRFAMKENNGVALASSLSKFSHIMRETLESSYKEYVTIRQELEFLKEYLEIQKMRFPSTFNYSLMIDGELDAGDTLIPSMIIQPFIENSIEHGFAAINYPGELRVDFKQENKLIKIEITDNGQGLSSPGSRQNEHISRASQIIKDRIYLLNIKLKSKAAFSIDNNKNGPGVSVLIQLPLLYQHENTTG
ncbi:MAG: histidine kinase [Chitinophagaceae bacterium]|nr:histidine kinase [Chitinophagaceae bacterium]MBP6588523.1 histidine kinase [Chitinophagaceae bacterium]